MSVVDDGFLRFPSVTFCKTPMYDTYPLDLLNFLDTKQEDGKLSVNEFKQWIRHNTHNQSRMFKLVSHTTNGGPNHFPCNTVSGGKPGKPCIFLFVYPDCQLHPKSNLCNKNSEQSNVTAIELIFLAEFSLKIVVLCFG